MSIVEAAQDKHLEWCKQRAYEYLDAGDVEQAWASFVSDMGKHEKTRGHIALEMGMMMFISGQLGTIAKMTKFIDGFN